MHLHHCCLILLIASTSFQSPAAQKPAAPQEKPATAAIDVKDLPVSLDRIQRALANTPKLRFDPEGRPVFRVEVFGKAPTIDDILGPDWATGPVKYGTMTHQEFVAMVTPKEMQGFAEYTNAEGAQLATSSFVLQWTLQKAIRKFKETQDEREREAARKEVIDALNALEAAQVKMKRPPK